LSLLSLTVISGAKLPLLLLDADVASLKADVVTIVEYAAGTWMGSGNFCLGRLWL
jgi:hypothetical protein